mgnify:CR=1 FL=1
MYPVARAEKAAVLEERVDLVLLWGLHSHSVPLRPRRRRLMLSCGRSTVSCATANEVAAGGEKRAFHDWPLPEARCGHH